MISQVMTSWSLPKEKKKKALEAMCKEAVSQHIVFFNPDLS